MLKILKIVLNKSDDEVKVDCVDSSQEDNLLRIDEESFFDESSASAQSSVYCN